MGILFRKRIKIAKGIHLNASKSVWVQNIENEHLVLKLEKEHEESAVYTTNERNTTTLSLERLNHM